jgi:hypothetical protein
MKRILFVLLIAMLVLGACASQAEAPQVSTPQESAAQEGAQQAEAPQASPTAEPTPSAPVLTVSDGTTERAYTREDLEALGAVEIDNGEAVYVGVLLKTLLEDAGIDTSAISAVKALAIDGFSSNYGPDLFLADTTLVAYARSDGPLTPYDGDFRMVLPDQAGSMNARLLGKLIAIQ